MGAKNPNAQLSERAEVDDKTELETQVWLPLPPRARIQVQEFYPLSAQQGGVHSGVQEGEETSSASGRLQVHSSILPHGRGGQREERLIV